MSLKDVQQKLKDLRDRIRADGKLSPGIEQELQDLLSETLTSANDEITALQDKLNATLSLRAGNDNAILSDEQKRRLRLVEKTGTGSQSVH